MYQYRLAKPLIIVIPQHDNPFAKWLANIIPFSLQALEPTIAIELFFNKLILPSRYKVSGGLGIFFNFEGYILSLILIIFILLPPDKLLKILFIKVRKLDNLHLKYL